MRRRRGTAKSGRAPVKKKSKSSSGVVDWEYDSSEAGSDTGNEAVRDDEEAEETEETKETADEKRIRLAKAYLKKVEEEEEEEESAASEEEKDEVQEGVTGIPKHDKVTSRIQNELLSKKGRLRREVAQKLIALQESASDNILAEAHYTRLSLVGHKKPPTAIAVSEAEDVVYSGSKDCAIIKWDLETGKELKRMEGLPMTKTYRKVLEYPGHRGEVLALALSSDGRYLCSGGREKLVYIWDTRTDTIVDKLKGHRDGISGLAFQLGTYQLMSSSFDRSVRVWNARDVSFIEELYGHQSPINDIDSLYRERGITVSEDRTVRFWKIPEETQLVFNAYHKASVDTVKMVDEVHFVAGAQDGSISLWHTSKKKPCSVIQAAHGGKWITSVTALRNSNLVASGSHDGYINLWALDFDAKRISDTPCCKIRVEGFVNALAFTPSGNALVAAVGVEHRFGRWETEPGSKNSIEIFRLGELLTE